MKKEKPVKSPFVESRTITGVVSSRDIIDRALSGLVNLAKSLEMGGAKVSDEAFASFIAGYTEGLQALGLSVEEAQGIGRKILKEIDRIEEHGCGKCANCKANKAKENGRK